jgi:hypothetical protein
MRGAVLQRPHMVTQRDVYKKGKWNRLYLRLVTKDVCTQILCCMAGHPCRV